MNKGIICKVKIDDKYHYCIRLENTVKIKDKNGKELEYNIFLFETNCPCFIKLHQSISVFFSFLKESLLQGA